MSDQPLPDAAPSQMAEALSPADVAALSALIDEALELPSEAIAGWLARLPAEHARLAPRLRRMLAERTSVVDGFLSRPAAHPVGGTVARTGDRVGPYRLVRELGVGGMGAVWLAERDDGVLRRRVALKLPRLAWNDDGLAERMARERDIGALLEHPNIARLYDAGLDEGGRPFIALEVIDGVPLDRWWRESGASLEVRLRLFVQVARAVAYAHGRLVVHRDLKPSNILVDAAGQAHLLDFGIAKLLGDVQGDVTREHGRMLTPQYAAPEHLRGEAASVSCDIWSLGVLLFELLTGRLPFQTAGTSPGALERAILEAETPLPSAVVPDKATARLLRGDLDAIVAKALRPEPAQRYATADALADDLQRHLDGERVLAQPDRLSYRLRKALRRHWLGVTATTCVLVTVVGGTMATALQARKALEAAERERVVRKFVAEMFRADGAVGGTSTGSPTARVEGGARLIEARFSGQPGLQAELYGVVSGVFLDMGANRLAADYAGRELSSRTAAHAQRDELAVARLRRAEALFEDQRYPEAEALLRPLAGDVQTSPAIANEAQILFARTLLKSAKLEEAKPVLEKIDPHGAEASTRKAWAQAIRAELDSHHDLAGAPPHYDAAIRTAIQAEGLHSTTAMEIRLLAAPTLCRSVDETIAEPYFRAAEAELGVRGGPFTVRAALERARFRWYCANVGKGNPTVALEAIARSRAELERSTITPPDLIFKTLDYYDGALRATYGDLSHLEQLVAAADVLRIDASPDMVRRLSNAVGPALSTAGREREAMVFLRQTLDESRRIFGSSSTDVAYDHVTIAWAYIENGHPDAALRELDQAEHELSDKGEPRFVEFMRDGFAGVQASALNGSGRPQEALAILAPRFRGDSGSSDPWRRNMDLIYMGEPWGEALCVLHRPREGLPHLLAGLARHEEVYFADVDPPTARQRAVTGLCELDLGQVDEARRLARLARAAFDKQPGVVAFYTAPLVELEGRLEARALNKMSASGPQRRL